MEPILQEIYDSIVDGDQNKARQKVQQAIEANIEPSKILNEAMISAMSKVGQMFEEGEYFVPEMLVSARAMQAGLSLLKPLLVKTDFKALGKVCSRHSKGDLHDIGKNLVCMMLEGAAFEVIDLGVDVSPEKFVEAIKETNANIVAMSALLTTTMPNMKVTIDALIEAGIRDKVKVMVGGAPLTDHYAKEIGADGYAPDASRAAILAKSLVA
jgi:5-methyltetrahydrofolate--homocysteine methyltransferase